MTVNIIKGDFEQPQVDQAPPEPTTADDQPKSGGFKPDDDQIALELADQLKERAAFFHSNWKIYDTGCWRERQSYEFRRFVRKELRQWRQFGVSVSQNRIRSLASMLEDDLFIPDRDIIDRQREQAKLHQSAQRAVQPRHHAA